MNSANLIRVFDAVKMVLEDGEFLGEKEKTFLRRALIIINVMSSKKHAKEQSIVFQTCGRCGREIDLKRPVTYKVCPKGFLYHAECEPLP